MTGTLAGRARGVDDANGVAPGRAVQRRVGLPSGRAVVGGLLMALAAVGTFVAYQGAAADDTIDVVVADRDLRAGELLSADDLRLVPVGLPDDVRGLFGAIDAAVGRQVVGPVDRGEFVQASSTISPVEGSEALEVTIALPGSRAVGRLAAGERVDVFSTWGGSVTELVAVDARVLEISSRAGDALATGELVTVRLAVQDFEQVEAVVHAQAAGDLTLIRAAIGSEVEDVGREYRPLSGGRSAGSDDHGDEAQDAGGSDEGTDG